LSREDLNVCNIGITSILSFCPENGGKHFFVKDNKDSLGTGYHSSIRLLDFSLMKKLPAFAADVVAYKKKRLMHRGRTQIIDFHVPGHGKHIQRTIEFAHGLIQKGRYDASMDVAGRPFVQASELHLRCGDRVFGACHADSKTQMKPLRIGWSAAKAVIGLLIDSRR